MTPNNSAALRFSFFPLLLILISPAMDNSGAADRMNELTIERDTVLGELRAVLDAEFVLWYPLCIDTSAGGYFSDINYKWEVEGRQEKMIVTQARHVWSTAHAALFYQRDNVLRDAAAHGVRFLRDKMWDREYGGFFNLVTREGEPIGQDGELIKQAYGNAFAIFGLAAYFRTSGDTAALELARKAFNWLEKHSFDPLHGGYFQFMARDGTPLPNGYRGAPPKDQNSTIHLLEAFTELYRAWPDDTVRDRLQSLLHIVRDVVTTEKGYMVLSFHRDWSPISYRDSAAAVREKNYEFDHVSFGHDIETAYLMLEASEALGLEEDETTLRVAKRMVDHVLAYGWDRQRGGIFDGGYYEAGSDWPAIVRKTKEWWAQIEACNTLLLMSELFPDDDLRYFEKFLAQWEYCKRYVLDGTHGGWYWGGVDAAPEVRHGPKGTIWKATYHTSRSLINCISRLRTQDVLAVERKRFEPVNKNATPEARRLLEYLYSISGTKIIAGHHNYVGRIDTYPNRVRELTGKTPAVWGCDFIEYYRPGVPETIVREAHRKHREEHIITLMWHAGRPMDDPPFGWKESVQAKLTDQEWEELTTPGTRLHTRWLEQIDTVAAFLRELQRLNVPVLWRPYHELNGVWFWWGNRKGENGSAKLYKMMFDRYVNHHKLDNLLWVWNANAPRQLIDDEAYAYDEYFPGLEYVDVLGADVYHNDYRQSHHDDLVELGKGKVLALAEVGEVPSPKILERQPRWTWFMIWGDFVNSHNTPQQIRDLYSYPGIVTHEDLVKTR